MLKQRVLTALVLGPFIIWSILTFSHLALAIEMGLIVMLAGWEWARMAGIRHQLARVAYALVVAGFLLFITWLLHRNGDLQLTILYVSSVGWLAAMLAIIYFNKKAIVVIDGFSIKVIVLNLLVGILVLTGAYVAVIGLHRFESGAAYILILFILIWGADTFAYFAGKAFGKHKLAVNVSPGKTWEGVAGGVAGTVIVAYIITIYLGLASPSNWYFVIITIITVGFSIVGDLIVSLFKRRAGVKDSSQLLPGHGGILDRIDSLLSASPIFLLCLLLAGVK